MTTTAAAPARPLRPRWRRWLWRFAALAAVLLALWLWASGLLGLALHYYNMRSTAAEWQQKGIWLPSYHVDIEARPVAGLEDNLSGLTWSPETGTLFAAINRPPAIAELTREGELLRLIPLDGSEDPEGITHVEGPVFVISDEELQSLNWVVIGPETTRIDLAGTPQLRLNYGAFHNMGYEGVSWDSQRRELLIAQEMLPIRVLKVSGLDEAIRGEGLDIEVREWQPRDLIGHVTADLSSLSAHDPTGNLLLLSDLTGSLTEYAADGRPVSVMPLWSGWHGLQAGIAQAEGLALDDRGDIYIVSEPNLLYRFRREKAAGWAQVAPELAPAN